MTNLFLTNTDMAAVTPSGAEVTRHKANSAAGAASTVRNKNSVVGPVAPTKVTDSATAGTDGNTIAWYSDRLQSVTIAGAITASLWTRESVATANIAPTIGVYRCDQNGVELATIVNPATNYTAGEMGTTAGGASDVITITAAQVVDTALSAGDRLKIALFIDDAAAQGGVGNTAAGNAQFWVNGPTGVAGQSQIAFTETLVAFAPAIAARPPYIVAQEGVRRSHLW